MTPCNVQRADCAMRMEWRTSWVHKSIHGDYPLAHHRSLYSIVNPRVFSLCFVAVCASAPSVVAYPVIEYAFFLLHVFRGSK